MRVQEMERLAQLADAQQRGDKQLEARLRSEWQACVPASWLGMGFALACAVIDGWCLVCCVIQWGGCVQAARQVCEV